MAVAMGLAVALLLVLPAAAFAGYINYPNFKRTSGLQLNGTAHVVGGDAVRLTDDYGQAASMFTVPSAIDATQPLHTSFTFSLQDDGGGQADGLTFAIQRDPQGEHALGASGGGLGYAGYDDPFDPFPPIPPITKSVAVAFNIYGTDDVSVLKNGDRSSPAVDPVPTDLFGVVQHAWVDYSPSKQKLKVYVDDTDQKPSAPTTQGKINLKSILGGASARAGFTAGTGGEYAIQDIQSWKVSN